MMMKLKTLLLINTAVFSVGTLVHLLRVASNGKFVILGAEIPVWLSAAFVVVATYLAYQNYKNAKK